MKIIINSEIDNYDLESQTMKVETNVKGSVYFSVYPLYECPEDAIIGRDLISCDEIAEAMKVAYEAGKAGEDFIIEKVSECQEQ